MWLPRVGRPADYGERMSSPLRPRGPLPARIYWTRRIVVVGVAVLLVAGLARLLGAGSDASDGGDRARQVSAPAATTPAASADEQQESRKPRRKKSEKPTRAPKPAPDGPCSPSDIVVTPQVRKAVGGSDIDIRLDLRTEEAEACTWQVSPDTMTLKITSGSDLIWTSSECPADLPTEVVVVRRDFRAGVVFSWDARRSDDDCPQHTEWALPGTYHVVAAALAGEPTEVRFELTRPTGAVITKTVTPKPGPEDKADRDKKADRDEKPDRDRKAARDGNTEPGEQSPAEHEADGDGSTEPNG